LSIHSSILCNGGLLQTASKVVPWNILPQKTRRILPNMQCKVIGWVKNLTKEQHRKMIGWFILAVYMIVLLKITVLRQDFLRWPLFSHGSLNLVPFAYYVRAVQHHHFFNIIYYFFGNIVWLMPLGFLLPKLTGWPRTLRGAAAAGFLLSFIIEFSQYAFGTGESELDDLILNTLGAILGFLLFRYLERRKITN
jgi:glycopeptide antibiotics resistance protein